MTRDEELGQRTQHRLTPDERIYPKVGMDESQEKQEKEGRAANPDGVKWHKKEEFSGIMRCMGPENSFPQICVVSGMSMF
jgi:hypothetical protein